MRILFTFIGGNGHFIPLTALARAAQSAGHTVAFGCGPSMAATVRAAGFTVYTLGEEGADDSPTRLPLRPLDPAREDQEFRDGFARRGAQSRVPLTLALCADWRPDVLVCDEADFGGLVAAERLGLPHATVLVMAAGSFVRPQVVGDALHELRALHNLPPDPQLEKLWRDLVLSPFPPSFRDPAFPLPATAFSFCPQLPQSANSSPAWSFPVNAPIVYFTLGTIFNMESGDLFACVLAGLRDLPINLVVTVGSHIDPAEFGPQPANVRIERYIPQETVLPQCSLIVSHAGSGSVSGALLHGLPSVLIPMGADQPLNAARCVELGLAQMLDPLAATPESVRAAVSAVLSDSDYRQSARRLQAEFTALPGPTQALNRLEQLVLKSES